MIESSEIYWMTSQLLNCAIYMCSSRLIKMSSPLTISMGFVAASLSIISVFGSLITCCLARNYMLHECRIRIIKMLYAHKLKMWNIVSWSWICFPLSIEVDGEMEKAFFSLRPQLSRRRCIEVKAMWEVNWPICLHDFMIYVLGICGGKERKSMKDFGWNGTRWCDRLTSSLTSTSVEIGMKWNWTWHKPASIYARWMSGSDEDVETIFCNFQARSEWQQKWHKFLHCSSVRIHSAYKTINSMRQQW